jgi:hypothetical protein
MDCGYSLEWPLRKIGTTLTKDTLASVSVMQNRRLLTGVQNGNMGIDLGDDLRFGRIPRLCAAEVR